MIKHLLIGFFTLSELISNQVMAQQTRPVTGAGATFPSQVYANWIATYAKEKHKEVKYTPTGSSDGIKQAIDRHLDFGATDSPLSVAELTQHKLIQFPTMVGGIVPVINMRGIDSLKLSGPVLAAIFSGEIENWGDARITSLNPGLTLPRTPITVVVRKDGSGTTETFTKYLASQNTAWTSTIGVGKQVKWNANAHLEKGNDGVAQALKKTMGAIGYISFDRARTLGLTMVNLKNAAGNYVKPSEASFTAAIKAANLYKNQTMIASLINLDGNDSWPITDMTYILMDATPKREEDARGGAQFFYWAFLKGDNLLNGTGFSPLPVTLQALVTRKLSDIRPQDGKILELTAK